MTHEIKILDVFADEVLDGNKKFEVRMNDRNYQRGDFVKFHVVYDTAGGYRKDMWHPLNNETYEITYVLSGWGLKDGYVAFAIERVPTVEEQLEGVK